jgi:putative drug exporter of the RND superfamily
MGFAALGRSLVQLRWGVLGFTVVLAVTAGVASGDVADRLSAGGFDDPDAEATRAAAQLSSAMGAGVPNLVLLIRPVDASADVDDPAVAAAAEAITSRLAADADLTQVGSYWTLGRPPALRSATGDSALILAHARGDQDRVDHVAGRIIEQFDAADENGTVSVRTGGLAAAYHQAGETVERDLRRAELLALPITLVVLVLVFRSVIAALIPVLGGILAIIGTLAVLRTLTAMTEVSVFALNLTTALGLGLAIDYSLFVVSRYREERRRGLEPHPAVIRTVATAGRSVAVSGITVAVSLAALLLFPMAFLRSFAYAGIPVVALAVLAATVVLPAALAVLGDRVDALAIGPRRRAPVPEEHSRWYRAAMAVMRRPVTVAAASIVALVALAVPFTRFVPGLPDDRVLPIGTGAREVGDTLRAEYPTNEAGALAVVMPGAALSDAELDRYAAALSRLDHAGRVDARTGIYLAGDLVLPPGAATARFETPAGGGEWLSVVPGGEPLSPESEELVRAVRDSPAPAGAGAVLVGGPGAEMLDTKAAVLDRLPWALAVVGGTTFVLLMVSFGSLLVPVKAIVLNLLSLTATFGTMVWIFQDGNLSGLLGFTPTGMLDLTVPILMFCVAFGLSMDYEVFLLSRIREEHDRSAATSPTGRGDTRRAVALGLARSGRIITAAAATVSVVLLAFSTSSITFVKLFGIGLATAVILDATVVRAVVVPAFMRLAGDANWWAPRWLGALHRRIDLREPSDLTTPAPLGPHQPHAPDGADDLAPAGRAGARERAVPLPHASSPLGRADQPAPGAARRG